MNAQSETLTAPAAPDATGRHNTRSIIAGTVGNAVEAFDWMIYTSYVIYFGKQFFPAGNQTTTLLEAFIVFAIGFAMRPLGGWLLGAIADRIGRRVGLMAGIMSMACASLVIAILPTYASIGLAAPILLALMRMLQGLSVGGEYATATLFLAESAPARRRGFYASFQFSSVAVGMLAASGLTLLMTQLMTPATLEAWGWRIPFALGGCSALVGLWMRRSLAETPAFEKLRSAGPVQKRPLWWTWVHHPKAVLLLIGVTVLGAFSFYLFVSFMPVFAIQHGASPSTAFAASTTSIALFMVAQPLFGALSDRIGRRPQLLVFALGYLLFLYPVVMHIHTSFISLLLVESFGMLLYGLYTAIAPAVMVELFPTEVRGIGIGANYNLIVAILGGTTPYLMTYAGKYHHTGWFLAYVCIGALIGLITYWFMPETVGMDIS